MAMMDVTIAVATYGDDGWIELASRRAVPSALALDVSVVHVHGDTLTEARNAALARVDTEWVIFLDADDELEPGYIDAMATGTAGVRAPSVRYVRRGRPDVARMPRVAGHHHDCVADCLAYGNWLIVGSAVRTDLVRKVGGWHDYPVYEDWDLWARCWLSGATIEAIPNAVYRAHVRHDSRNRAPQHAAKMEAHRMIARANRLPIP
jgi:glycosyltransferase involved in cell wall biosynthesis